MLAALFTAPSAAVAASFDAHGSVEQVYATGLTPGAPVTLLDEEGHEVASRIANPLGGTLFRNVTPGPGYTVASEGEESSPEGYDLAFWRSVGGAHLFSPANGSSFSDYLADVDAHFERARAAGARIDKAPEDLPYGRSYGARDLEGHVWYFTTPPNG